MNDYRIIFERASSNWGAYSPDVPGCVTTGKTREQTRANMLEALDFHLQSIIADGDPVPVPHGAANGTLSPAAQRRLAWLRARRAKSAARGNGASR